MSGYEIPTRIRGLVGRRSLGYCERCGARGSDLHHRKRGNPRVHLVENLVRLCRPCHRWATIEARTAYLTGWVLRHPDNAYTASAVPLALLGRVWVSLTPAGEYSVGGITFGNIGEIWQALDAMRVERVGPPDSLPRTEPGIPRPGIVEYSPSGQRRAFDDLIGPVGRPRIPAGFLVRRGEDLSDPGPGEFEEL